MQGTVLYHKLPLLEILLRRPWNGLINDEILSQIICSVFERVVGTNMIFASL